jgi:hypothetical protein
MGTLSRLLSSGGGPRPRSNGSRSGPLRKIVSTEFKGDAPYETLECGHTMIAKRDLMGFTNAYRRRCWQCKTEATKEDSK